VPGITEKTKPGSSAGIRLKSSPELEGLLYKMGSDQFSKVSFTLCRN